MFLRLALFELRDVEAEGVKLAEDPGKQGWQASQAQRAAEREKEQAKLAQENHIRMQILLAVREKAATTPRSTLDMQLIAQVAWDGVEWEDKETICELYNQDNPNGLEGRIGSMNAGELSTFLLDCALIENVQTNYINHVPARLLTAAKHYGVDVASVRKAAAAEFKEQEKEAAKTDKQTAAANDGEDGEEVDA